MPTVSPSEAQRIGRLCHIAQSEDEASRMAADLSRILEYVEKLQELNTADVPPTNQVTEQTDVHRNDTVVPADDGTVGALVAAIPDREGRGVRVPPVLDRP